MYRLRKMAQFASGKILDIGFADQPNPYLRGEVYGFDRQPTRKPVNYTDLITGDVVDLIQHPECYDTILAGEIIEHLEHPRRFLEACYHLLRPGGCLVLSTPNPYYPPVVWLERLMIRRYFYAEDHYNLLLPRFLLRMVEQAGFRDVRAYSGGIVIPGLNWTLPFPRAYCYAIIYVGKKST
ncbi:MAG: methyltransferase domain-containing protein [Anaerolineae bacterium]|nr:methyltransferase domain-containing protein [Anaerolineae bacterium]